VVRRGRYPPKLRERAVRMVAEISDQHESEWRRSARLPAYLGRLRGDGPQVGAPGAGVLVGRSPRLLEQGAAVDWQRHAGDVPGFVGGQEQHRVANILRLHVGDRQRVVRGAIVAIMSSRVGFSKSGRNIR